MKFVYLNNIHYIALITKTNRDDSKRKTRSIKRL